MTRPYAWSLSALGQYEECPRKYEYSRILKIPEPKHPAAERGIEIHKKGESYLKGLIPERTVPLEYVHFKYELKELRRLRAEPEAAWGVTRTWKAADFFGKTVWGRGKIDAHVVIDTTLHLIDFKTGRRYPKHEEQAEVYALFGAAYYPKVEKVAAEFWYLDESHNEPLKYEYTVKELKSFRTKWQKRADKMLTAKKFLPTPGDHCKRCHYASFKGGQCLAWKATNR